MLETSRWLYMARLAQAQPSNFLLPTQHSCGPADLGWAGPARWPPENRRRLSLEERPARGHWIYSLVRAPVCIAVCAFGCANEPPWPTMPTYACVYGWVYFV